MVVAGGSVAGLSFASEAAKRGLDVIVLEEDREIGEPEKCDGLVSLRGLRMYGFAPATDCIQSQILEGVVHSPSGTSIKINTRQLEVFVLDRSNYDKQLLSRAEDWGVKVKLDARVMDVRESEGRVTVEADGNYESALFVDATGPAGALKRYRGDLLPAAKYELEGDWFEEHRVEVFMDQQKYPGFFAWVIPMGDRKAKVGVAGRGINTFRSLDSFLSERDSRILRRAAAPIYVGGLIERFVSGRKVYVGESAGQVKPTTAGGIMTSIASAVIAARWTFEAIRRRDLGLLQRYQLDWDERFGKEFRRMEKLRGVYERLSNHDLEALIAALSSPAVLNKLGSSDFDFHATSILGALGLRGLLRITKTVAGAGAKELIDSLR